MNHGFSKFLILVIVAILVAGGVFAWWYLKEKPPIVDWASTYELYEYSEFAPPDQTWVYTLRIYRQDSIRKANLDIDGFQTLTRLKAIAKEQGGNLDIIFDSYRPENIGEPYQKGDLLFSLKKISDSEYQILWNKMKSNLLEPGDAKFKKILKDETASWQIYRNEELGVEFQHPQDWKIIQDAFYETAGGIRAEVPTVILSQENNEDDSTNWIRINPRQFQTSAGTCLEIAINFNSMCTYSKDSRVLDILKQTLSTFRFLVPE